MQKSNRKANCDSATSSAHLPDTTLAHPSPPTSASAPPSDRPVLTKLETAQAYTYLSLTAMPQTLLELGI